MASGSRERRFWPAIRLLVAALGLGMPLNSSLDSGKVFLGWRGVLENMHIHNRQVQPHGDTRQACTRYGNTLLQCSIHGDLLRSTNTRIYDTSSCVSPGRTLVLLSHTTRSARPSQHFRFPVLDGSPLHVSLVICLPLHIQLLEFL